MMTPSPVLIPKPQCKRCKLTNLRCDPQRPCRWCNGVEIGAEECVTGNAPVDSEDTVWQQMLANAYISGRNYRAGGGERGGKSDGLDGGGGEGEGDDTGFDLGKGIRTGETAEEGPAGEEVAAADTTFNPPALDAAAGRPPHPIYTTTSDADKRFLCSALDYLSRNRLSEACEIVRRRPGMEDWSVEHIQGNLAAEMPDEVVRELLGFVKRFVREDGGGERGR